VPEGTIPMEKHTAKTTFAAGFVVVPATLPTLQNCRSAMILCEKTEKTEKTENATKFSQHVTYKLHNTH
jgi:hypothetical protein